VTLRLCLFGRTGQVAREVLRLAGADLSVVPLDRNNADLADPEACSRAIERMDADAVLNAAAFSGVDLAESQETLATRINAEAPAAMARACARRGLPFLHISTDYVFDGTSGSAWREDDPTAPINAYGRSKLAGETAVRSAGGVHVILRTSWVFSAQGSNFLLSMLRLGAERRQLTVVDDQTGGPTPADSVAQALVAMARQLVAGDGHVGTYHFCGRPAVTWYGFAREIFARASLPVSPELTPITSSDWPSPARRPANSLLDCTRIETEYGVRPPNWRQGLDRCLAAIRHDGPDYWRQGQ